VPEKLAADTAWSGFYTMPVLGGAGKVFVSAVTVQAVTAAGVNVHAHDMVYVRIKRAEKPAIIRLTVGKTAFPNSVRSHRLLSREPPLAIGFGMM
jgi:hypothetical protein